MKLLKGKVGRNACEVSKVWSLGFHAFKTEHSYILRLCYLRNKNGTHYIQVYKDRQCYTEMRGDGNESV